MLLTSMLALAALAFACEAVDSSLGMGYGTILSPLLLLMGFPPQTAVPAVLLSQAIGGGVAGVFHHRLGNARFSRGTRDTTIMLVLAGLCIVATVVAAVIGLSSAPKTISMYIGILVTVMGVVIVADRRLRFTWPRMSAAGIISAFNKGISGGGFGPVVAGSLVIVGQEAKAAVATTVAAEVPVCVAGFLTYLVAQGQSNDVVRWDLTLVLCVGAGVAGTLGPWATRYLAKWRMHLVLGVFIAVLGIWTIVKSWG